ncbi:hypothetical protein [Xanthomonas sp. 60]
MRTLPLAGLLLLSMTACNRTPETTPDTAMPNAEASATDPARPDVVSASPDLAVSSPVDPRPDSPARLDGFGAVPLGASIDEVRSRFGEPLQGLGTDAAGKPLAADDGNEDCYLLRPEKAAPEGPFLMIEGRRLVRFDVRGPAIVAPGGGRVGMSLGELQQLYPERADLGPDKYDPQAQHLRVRPQQEGNGIVDFTLDANGKVSQWRVGRSPQVDYAEGCG